MSTKRIMLIVMCTLLIAVLITTCIVVNKVSALFDALNATTPPTTAPTTPTVTEPSTEPTQPTVTEPEPSTEPTEPTEPPVTGPHEHNFVWTTSYSPTCTAMGYTLYTCECGKTTTRDFRDPKGHDYGEPEVSQLTCEQNGYTKLTCQRCNAVEYRDEQIAPGHDYQFAGIVAPSCAGPGYDAHICSRCHDVRKENLIDALEHTFEDWMLIPGTGREQRICSACECTEYRDIDGETDLIVIKSRDDSQPDWTHYTITVTHLPEQQSFTYDIYICLEERTLTYIYGDTGLKFYFNVDGLPTLYTLPADTSIVVTVDADGVMTEGAPKVEPDEPDPTDPTEPSDPTDPSDPTEPTEPEETEPTDPTEATEETAPSEDTDD